MTTPVFGATTCPTCKVTGCLAHLTIEQDYPASAWDTSTDYGPHDPAAPAPTMAALKVYGSAASSARLANGPRRCEDDATDCDCAGPEVKM